MRDILEKYCSELHSEQTVKRIAVYLKHLLIFHLGGNPFLKHIVADYKIYVITRNPIQNCQPCNGVILHSLVPK